MADLTLLEKVLIWAVPVILAIPGHEVAHGGMAARLGDPTARDAGRLSLNPLRHLDPVGSLLVPSVLLFFGGFLFGWARPVPVNAGYFRHPARDMALVALAGPMANLAMAFAWAMGMKFMLVLDGAWPEMAHFFLYMGAAGVFINTGLAMFNLLPLPPLDGARIVQPLLPRCLATFMRRAERWGLLLVVVLLASGILAKWLWPMMTIGMAVSTHLARLPVGLLTDLLRALLVV